jgi:hypothetical protein
MRGGQSPPLSYTPLSSQYVLFLWNGSGWRGVRDEVEINNQMQTEPTLILLAVSTNSDYNDNVNSIDLRE